jgi:predicted alpha/beta-hydrolase family hydrolase
MVKPQLLSGPAHGPYLVLAHGAGSAMDSAFMTAMAEALAAHGIAVARFEFAYMAARRQGGKRAPPPPLALLEDEYRAFLAQFAPAVAAIGGSSLGGRVASRIVDGFRQGDAGPGLVCLSYPFHLPGRPHSLRTAHLENLLAPALIVQGERDPFGTRSEVEAMSLSPRISLHWLADGGHRLKPRKSSGASRAGNIAAAATAIARFMAGL